MGTTQPEGSQAKRSLLPKCCQEQGKTQNRTNCLHLHWEIQKTTTRDSKPEGRSLGWAMEDQGPCMSP